jgi:hypothetical protein
MRGIGGQPNEPRRPAADNTGGKTMSIPRIHPDTTSFELADEAIRILVMSLRDKNACPCCVAWALAYHAATSAMHAVGSDETIEMFKDIISDVLKRDIPLPERGPSAEMH